MIMHGNMEVLVNMVMDKVSMPDRGVLGLGVRLVVFLRENREALDLLVGLTILVVVASGNPGGSGIPRGDGPSGSGQGNGGNPPNGYGHGGCGPGGPGGPYGGPYGGGPGGPGGPPGPGGPGGPWNQQRCSSLASGFASSAGDCQDSGSSVLAGVVGVRDWSR